MSLPETHKVLLTDISGGPPQIKEVPLPKPGANQVVVKIEYSPLNPSDIFTIRNTLGMNTEDSQVGREASGTIAAIGNDLTHPFNVGDRVHVVGISWESGGFAQYWVTNTDNVSLIQGDLSFEEAASHFINPATVYLMGLTAQRGGHKAVIHTAGASALGRMLIRYFKQLGIKLVNVVRRDEYIEELKKEGADYVLNLKADDFEEKLKEIVEKENVTMALEAIAGDFTNKIVKILPIGSTTYVYGSLSFADTCPIDVFQLIQGKAVSGLNLFSYAWERKNKGDLQQYYKELHDLLPTVFKTNVIKVFKLEEIHEALKFYDDNCSKGKILIKPN